MERKKYCVLTNYSGRTNAMQVDNVSRNSPHSFYFTNVIVFTSVNKPNLLAPTVSVGATHERLSAPIDSKSSNRLRSRAERGNEMYEE
jgi:hypothetical protein